VTACKSCEIRIVVSDVAKKRINHLSAAAIKEKISTLSGEKALKILSDLIITSISAVDAKAQAIPMNVLL
jgi:hypothetical protein